MLLKILIILCVIKFITWVWPKVPKQWIKAALGIKSPSGIGLINTGHGCRDVMDEIVNYDGPQIVNGISTGENNGGSHEKKQKSKSM